MRQRVFALLAALTLSAALSGCGDGGETVTVWRAVRPEARGSGALVAAEALPAGTAGDGIAGVLAALAAEAEDPALGNPLPADGGILDWRLEGTQLELTLGEGYAALSGLDRTLADCCLTLSLCALDGVDSVRITVGRRVLAGPLSPADYLLADAATAPSPEE